jgi:hypothetical protein
MTLSFTTRIKKMVGFFAGSKTSLDPQKGDGAVGNVSSSLSLPFL